MTFRLRHLPATILIERMRSHPLPYRRLLARVATMRRARSIVSFEEALLCQPFPFDTKTASVFGNLPLRARLANQFGDAMLAMEEALSMCEVERDESRDASWIEPQIRTTYEQVNALMKAVCD